MKIELDQAQLKGEMASDFSWGLIFLIPAVFFFARSYKSLLKLTRKDK